MSADEIQTELTMGPDTENEEIKSNDDSDRRNKTMFIRPSVAQKNRLTYLMDIIVSFKQRRDRQQKLPYRDYSHIKDQLAILGTGEFKNMDVNEIQDVLGRLKKKIAFLEHRTLWEIYRKDYQ